VFSVLSVPTCYKQDSWGSESVVRQLPVGKNVSMVAEDIVEIRHQATTCEETADWKDLACPLVNCRACELATALQILVVTICKRSVTPITDPNPVYSHSCIWKYYFVNYPRNQYSEQSVNTPRVHARERASTNIHVQKSWPRSEFRNSNTSGILTMLLNNKK
jgi:hypothetical protein